MLTLSTKRREQRPSPGREDDSKRISDSETEGTMNLTRSEKGKISPGLRVNRPCINRAEIHCCALPKDAGEKRISGTSLATNAADGTREGEVATMLRSLRKLSSFDMFISSAEDFLMFMFTPERIETWSEFSMPDGQ
jgi:hypothetical protein